MTYITKPKFHHPSLPKNALGYTHRDYEGSISTLCAGCGHDSISGAIIEASIPKVPPGMAISLFAVFAIGPLLLIAPRHSRRRLKKISACGAGLQLK